MLHAKKYFCNFGILASTENSKLQSIFASFKTLDAKITPTLTKAQNKIKNAVKNQTKIEK